MPDGELAARRTEARRRRSGVATIATEDPRRLSDASTTASEVCSKLQAVGEARGHRARNNGSGMSYFLSRPECQNLSPRFGTALENLSGVALRKSAAEKRCWSGVHLLEAGSAATEP